MIIIVLDIIFVEVFSRAFNYDQSYIPIAKLLSDICLAVIITLLNIIFCHKSKLYEGEI